MPLVRCPNPACAAPCSVADGDAGRPVKCARCGQPFAFRPTLDGKQADTKKGRPAASTDLFPALPAEFGRYRVLRLLGKGGMGAVYLAEDSQLGRQVALKIPFFDAADSSQRAERFVREARSAASLRHPNVCTVFDAGEIAGRAFITMEFIEGKPLADAIDPDAPMPQQRAAEIARKVALALEHAHKKGVVHRDLKPANVMISADGEPVVMDFGLAKRVADLDPGEAKLTRLGGVIGTPSYMSPEQVRGDGDIGPASDVYSLGVMLFEMLTGKTPYGGSMGVIMGQILHAPVPPVREFRADADERLDAICRRAMAKEAAERYGSMAELAEALGSYANAPVAAAPAITLPRPEDRPPRTVARPLIENPRAAPRPLPLPFVPVVVVQEIPPEVAPRQLPPPPRRIPSAPAKQGSTFHDREEPPSRTRVARKKGKPSPMRPVMLAGIAAALVTLFAVVGVALFVAKPKGTVAAKPQPVPTPKDRAKEDLPLQPLAKENPPPTSLGKKSPTLPPLEKEITNSIGVKLVRIPAGKFMMGSPRGEGFDNEHPEHEVEITEPFYLGVYEVTQEEYEKVMGSSPSYFAATGTGKAKVDGVDTARFPVENVSYEDAVKFCERLTAREKEKKRLYRLPTEAEWEYSCRGGAGLKTTPFHFGNSLSSDEANFNGNYPYGGAAKGTYLERTCKVGSYKPNGYGLYDMHGNVWEWCSDWYGAKYYADSPAKNPTGPSEGSLRVLRGGSGNNYGGDCRSAYRSWYSPADRTPNSGFRVALVPSGE